MGRYKVPQDVEADDKLLGPFSFRQFVYLIIVAIAIGIAWGLSQLFIPLAIIPLPIVIFFGALALPLRKDQPMEIYLAAIVSFYLKPRRRLWQPDGIQSMVEITAPKIVEVQRTKDLSQAEARKRLSYLADIVDTEGWAIRGVAMPDAPSSMRDDVYFDAQQTEDILDDDGGVSRSFDAKLTEADTKRRQDMLNRMRQQGSEPAPEPVQQPPQTTFEDPYAALTPHEPQFTPASDPRFTFNPYPGAMKQSVITPLSEQPATPQQAPAPTPETVQQPPIPAPTPAPVVTPQPTPTPQPREVTPEIQVAPVEPAPQPAQQTPEPHPTPTPEPAPTTSEKPLSPDIISLANNSDLSIETIAHEANRINKRLEESDDEVVISLR